MLKISFISKLSILVLFIIGATSNLYTQVTIGSNLPANKGSLLDIKQKNSYENKVTTQKGLGLPRVVLTSDSDMRDISGATGQERDHIGLIVYNISDHSHCPILSPGIYVWNGKQWEELFDDSENKQDLSASGTTDTYKSANTYVMAPEKRIAIPIKRAFQIWKDYQSAIPGSPTQYEIENGKVLDLASVNNLSGKLSASIAWQEAFDNINTDVVICARIAGENEDAKLIVASGQKFGNALIQVHIGPQGNNTDPVFWQWQIWVPDGDPTATNATTYTLTNDDNNSWTFMDRNLGAIDTKPMTSSHDPYGTQPTTQSAHGVFYQWGRPTPIQRWGNVSLFVRGTNESVNFTKALTSKFFVGSSSYHDGLASDWYSINNLQYNNRWHSDRDAKSPFDPCPQGWRVPRWKGTPAKSPWANLTFENCIYDITCSGYTWTTPYNAGYYPFAGRRTIIGSINYNTGTSSMIWTATPSSGYYYACAFSLTINVQPIDNAQHTERSWSHSVRCVKE